MYFKMINMMKGKQQPRIKKINLQNVQSKTETATETKKMK